MRTGRVARGTVLAWMVGLAAVAAARPLGPPAPPAGWWAAAGAVPAAQAPRAVARMLLAPRLTALGPTDQQACLAAAVRLGFNRVALPEHLADADPVTDLNTAERLAGACSAVRAAGLTPVLLLAPWIPWTPHSRYSDDWLQAHPEAAAVLSPTCAAARQQRGMVSPTYLLDGDCTYFDQRLDELAELASRCAVQELIFDETANSPLDGSFDKLTLDAFWKVAGPPPARRKRPLGPHPDAPGGELLADPATRAAWIRFRCEQNAAILALLRRRLAGRVRQLRVLVRAGTQSEADVARYGVDWRLAATLGEVALVAAPAAASAGVPELADTFAMLRRAGNGGRLAIEESRLTAARLVLDAAAGATGLLAGPPEGWRAPEMAALAATATWLAEHEGALLAGRRTAFDTDGDGRSDTVALATAAETLVVVANDTDRPGAYRPGSSGLAGLPAAVTLAPGEWRTFRLTGAKQR